MIINFQIITTAIVFITSGLALLSLNGIIAFPVFVLNVNEYIFIISAIYIVSFNIFFPILPTAINTTTLELYYG